MACSAAETPTRSQSILSQSISVASVALNVFTALTVDTVVPIVEARIETPAIPILIPSATPMAEEPPEGIAATKDTIEIINPAVAAATPMIADVLWVVSIPSAVPVNPP